MRNHQAGTIAKDLNELIQINSFCTLLNIRKPAALVNQADSLIRRSNIKNMVVSHTHFDTWKNDDFSFKTIELKLGKAASPEALTQQAIAATDVEGLLHQTLRNETLKVDETGYYYFGIHDISEAGGYSVFADNFFVKNGPADGAPAAISDLAIADASAELGAAAPYCVAVAKGDPKGLLPEINAAIAKMLEEKAMDAFVEEANAINDAGNAIEVSVDAPEA